MAKEIELKIDYKALGEIALRSEEIGKLLIKEGNKMRNRVGKGAKVRYRKKYGKRYRVYVDAPYENASKDNKMLKSVK